MATECLLLAPQQCRLCRILPPGSIGGTTLRSELSQTDRVVPLSSRLVLRAAPPSWTIQSSSAEPDRRSRATYSIRLFTRLGRSFRAVVRRFPRDQRN